MYIGVKDFLDRFKEPFDSVAVGKKIAKKNNSIAKDETEKLNKDFEFKTNRGIEFDKILKQSYTDVIIGEYVDTGVKDYSSVINKLLNNTTYLDKTITLDKYKLVAVLDKVEIINNVINVTEFKTFDNPKILPYINNNGFTNYEKFKSPINHIYYTNLQYAFLQCSLYMYMIWQNNKTLKPNKEVFVENYILNEDLSVKKKEIFKHPYMRDEVMSLLKTIEFDT
jgi:hypothetical protein